jgi:hypothetical protein
MPTPASLLPVGSARSLCRACGQLFSTSANFDRHRRRGACLHPASAGLVEVGGVWKRPGISTTQALARLHRGAAR